MSAAAGTRGVAGRLVEGVEEVIWSIIVLLWSGHRTVDDRAVREYGRVGARLRSASQHPGCRHDRRIAPLGRSHLTGAIVVAVFAWTALLTEPGSEWLASDELRRAAVILALFDLVLGFSPTIGTAARRVRRWSLAGWIVLAAVDADPLLFALR